ncbi:transposase, partial [Pseudoalteromonas sp. McH1-42]|nr:transposase [Pseudoalteromonas sp. McH1-42]
TQFTKVFRGAVGRRHAMSKYCTHLQKKRRANLDNCERLLG